MIKSNDRKHKDYSYSVVIPAWNESALIESTLRSVIAAQEQQEYLGNIVVVDNNSSDDTAARARALGATVVFEPVNHIARTRNTGARATDADFLVFLDADTILNPALLKISLDALAAGDTIGGGSTVTVDTALHGASKHILGFWNWFSRKAGMAAGCYLYCTNEAFQTIGGFDEKRYAAEELILSRRLRKLAKNRKQKFVIFEQAPVVTSARKIDWYSTTQKVRQLLLLLIPGATKSKKMCTIWYDRSNIRDSNSKH